MKLIGKMTHKLNSTKYNVGNQIHTYLLQIRVTMVEKTKNIFITHIHKDDDGIPKLIDLVKSIGMTIHNYSITSDKPNKAKDENYIKSEILAPRIQQCSTLVVYITPETKDSDWTNWEIEYAHHNNKRIVGVWAHGEKGCELPEALKKYGDAVVGWTGNRIVDAINGDIDIWEFPNGSQFPQLKIKRFNCN